MKRIYAYLIVSVAMAALLSSCALKEILPQDQLTESEQMQVIDRARIFISKVDHLNISAADKMFIKTNVPKFHVNYTGYKSGVAKMVWTINPSYSIRVICNGNLLSESCPIRMSISRFKL